jgi:hypothetical protein
LWKILGGPWAVGAGAKKRGSDVCHRLCLVIKKCKINIVVFIFIFINVV